MSRRPLWESRKSGLNVALWLIPLFGRTSNGGVPAYSRHSSPAPLLVLRGRANDRQRARTQEFSALTDAEAERVEAIFAETFATREPPISSTRMAGVASGSNTDLDYTLRDAGGEMIDATITILGGRVTLHSRGGGGRNPNYARAFDAIFDRINVPGTAVQQVILASGDAEKAAPEAARILATRQDFETGVLSQVKNQIRNRMRLFGRAGDMPAGGGNATKKIRIDTDLPDRELARRLRGVPIAQQSFAGETGKAGQGAGGAASTLKRLPAEQLRRVRHEHVHSAVARLLAGEDADNFDPSRDYDAMTTAGDRLAPKKVFALALEDALGVEIFPSHFSAGWKTPCFDILEDAGLFIVPKDGSAARPKPSEYRVKQALEEIAPTDEERTWIEGNPRIVSHLKKERDPGLARSKRKVFIAAHGKLFCERCELDPAEEYGVEAGDACIEVHHHQVQVADMQPGHETSLDDLKCLCSNCHRVLHRALTLGVPFDLRGLAAS
jgi:hypothetical protein